jgi:hypothetical protein
LQLGPNPLIFKTLAPARVEAAWKIRANGLQWATAWDHVRKTMGVELDNAQLRRSKQGRSLSQFACCQSHGHAKSSRIPPPGANINLAAVCFLLSQVAKLPQELCLIEQFDLALDKQVLYVRKKFCSRLCTKNTDFVKDSNLQQVLTDDGP